MHEAYYIQSKYLYKINDYFWFNPGRWTCFILNLFLLLRFIDKILICWLLCSALIGNNNVLYVMFCVLAILQVSQHRTDGFYDLCSRTCSFCLHNWILISSLYFQKATNLLANGLFQDEFSVSLKMSTYLVAVIVGNLEYISKEINKILVCGLFAPVTSPSPPKKTPCFPVY